MQIITKGIVKSPTRHQLEVHGDAGVRPEQDLAEEQREVVHVHLVGDLGHPAHVAHHHLQRVALNLRHLARNITANSGILFVLTIL